MRGPALTMLLDVGVFSVSNAPDFRNLGAGLSRETCSLHTLRKPPEAHRAVDSVPGICRRGRATLSGCVLAGVCEPRRTLAGPGAAGECRAPVRGERPAGDAPLVGSSSRRLRGGTAGSRCVADGRVCAAALPAPGDHAGVCTAFLVRGRPSQLAANRVPGLGPASGTSARGTRNHEFRMGRRKTGRARQGPALPVGRQPGGRGPRAVLARAREKRARPADPRTWDPAALSPVVVEFL